MAKIEFNLLDEPWIRVLRRDCTVQEISIRDALLHASEYVDLAGEMVTQDVAILRMLIAIVHTIFSRVDETGEKKPFESEDDALERWATVWKMKIFPIKPLERYFEKWHERFWLFHPEYPFWQAHHAEIGTEYSSSKLNGEVLESANKKRLFSAFSGKEKAELSYAQSARWLLMTCGFDDNSSKAKGKNLPAVGAGWLGKIGLVYLQGNNLFETIWLNSVFLRDGERLWNEDMPCWELDEPRSAERVKISLPDNYAELLTLQSRRLILARKNDKVVGFSLLGGDFFDRENAFAEQMTAWHKKATKKDEPAVFDPLEHDPNKILWREFPYIFCEGIIPGDGKAVRAPGIVKWATILQAKRILDRKKTMNFKIASMVYGDSAKYFINDYYSDSLTVHTSLLNELSVPVRNGVIDEIHKTEKLALYLRILQKELDIALGGASDSQSSRQNNIQNEFYYEVDQPFRKWLGELDPEWQNTKIEEAFNSWRNTVKAIALKCGEKAVFESGPFAIVGKTLGDNQIHYSSPEALNHFRNKVYSLYTE